MIIQFLISLFFSIVILISSIKFLKKYFLDLPNYRSSHVKPIPRAGGISFVICGCCFSLLNGVWLPLMCLPLSLVGLIDDLRGLNPLVRYITQALTCLVLILKSNLYYDKMQNLPILWQTILIFLLILLGTAIINFLNFMDGIDGILASCMTIVFGSLAVLYFPYLIPFIGAIIGFLIFNWQPAKIFMGDTGSTFIGAVFVGCIFQISNNLNNTSIIFISAPLLFDAFICVMRRFFIGDNIFKPHKLHLYQRLNQAGFTHQRVSMIYLFATLFLSLCYIIGNLYLYSIGIVSTIIFGVFLEKKYAYPFKNYYILND